MHEQASRLEQGGVWEPGVFCSSWMLAATMLPTALDVGLSLFSQEHLFIVQGVIKYS